jgi:branched-subunit amino acid aminotransferase/4-amino-4-deoxychorismate lyase
VLPGITRGVLLDHGLAREDELSLDVLEDCSEIFLTSSTRGVHSVEKCGERLMAASRPLTKKISAEYAQIVANEMN